MSWTKASAPFRRLKPNLLLLLQILTILLLAVTLARPVRTVLVAGYARTVFIVDVSASMQATDIAGSRFAGAKAAAMIAASHLRPGQQAMLIAAGQEAQVVVPFTEDPDAIRRGLAGLAALDVPGRLSEALRLAQANLQVQGGPSAVELFTDGAFESPSLPDFGGAAVHWHRVGQRGKNVAITAFEARKTFFGAFDYQAFLSVANYSADVVTFDLALTLDGRPLKTERVTLTPELKRSFVFPFVDQTGGILKAEIAVDDDLAADNQALAVLPPPRPLSVLLVGAGNAFLEKALAADAQVKVETGTLELLEKKPSQYDVVILDGVPAKRVPPGRYLFVNTIPDGVPLEMQGRVQDPPIVDWDRAHPAMRYLDLSRVAIQDAMRIRPLAGGRVELLQDDVPIGLRRGAPRERCGSVVSRRGRAGLGRGLRRARPVPGNGHRSGRGRRFALACRQADFHSLTGNNRARKCGLGLHSHDIHLAIVILRRVMEKRQLLHPGGYRRLAGDG